MTPSYSSKRQRLTTSTYTGLESHQPEVLRSRPCLLGFLLLKADHGMCVDTVLPVPYFRTWMGLLLTDMIAPSRGHASEPRSAQLLFLTSWISFLRFRILTRIMYSAAAYRLRNRRHLIGYRPIVQKGFVVIYDIDNDLTAAGR
jgi:hypothetical protein